MLKYGYEPSKYEAPPVPEFSVFFPGGKAVEPAPEPVEAVKLAAPERVYYFLPWISGEA